MTDVYHNDENGYKSEFDAIMSYIFMCICIIISIMTLIHTIYQLFIKPDEKATKIYHKSMLVTSITSLVFNLLYCIVTVIIQTQNIFNSNPWGCVIASLNVPFLVCSRFCLYLFYLARYI